MSLRFYCAYCPDSFLQFRELVEHYKDRHSQKEIEFVKVSAAPMKKIEPQAEEQPQSRADSRSYGGTDSGCQEATNYLGRQSSCLRCPFRKCKLDEPGFGIIRAEKKNRNEEIKKLFNEGKKTKELAVLFDVQQRTIQRVVRKSGGNHA